MSPLVQQITVPLSCPVPVAGADGKTAERSSLIMKRPKVRHAKRLAVLIGKDLVEIIAGDASANAATLDKDGKQIARELFGHLLNAENLDGLTSLIADLCGEDPAVIDEVDTVDIMAVGMAFAGFFPALRSLVPGTSQETLSSSEKSLPA